MNWHERFDDNGNSYWESAGPYQEGLQWRLRQRLRNNKIEWYADHDPELGGDCDDASWESLDEAKASVEVAHCRVCAEVA